MTAVRPLRLGLQTAGVLFVVDQVSKLVIYEVLDAAGGFIQVTGFFNLVTVWNYGVSFGMLSGLGDHGAVILSVVSLVIVAFLINWLRRVDRRALAIALGAVVGGALGNVIDRVRFGAVFDFLDFHVAGWHWPAFNVADSAIVLGVGFIVIDSLFRPDTMRAGEKEKTE